MPIELCEITPKPESISKILFVPDENAKYDGAMKNNIRMNTSGNGLVDDLIRVFDAQFRLMNKGERAYQNTVHFSEGESDLNQMLASAQVLIESMLASGSSRNSPCICGSGIKYKRCHGNHLNELISLVDN